VTRDMDLVRLLLLRIEESPEMRSKIDLDFPGYTREQVHYHLFLLHDAKYVEGHDLSSTGGRSFLPTGLTWQGHEFLDAARDDTIWRKAKEEVKKSAVSVPVEIMKKVLLKAIAAVLPI
jgi:hypothetical protein